jgi:membrane-bound lytic murein transglycosylase D
MYKNVIAAFMLLFCLYFPYSLASVKLSDYSTLQIVALPSQNNQTLQIKALVPTANNTYQRSLWPQLSRQFELIQRYNQRTEVKNAVQWFLRQKTLLNQVLTNARPYLYYVYQQLKQQNLPGELALLPMIESGFNPMAYSNRTATGLWQMMPTTAVDLGSDISWWYDTRRDTIISTQYALQYLKQLHHHYKDWLLAIAAYNVGQGRIQQAINYNKSVGKKTDFWSLPLPRETRNYIPRLLALAQIIAHARTYNVFLPKISNAPYFSIIPIQSQITLTQVARLTDVDESRIQQLNPGLRRWATPPGMNYNLLVPSASAKKFESGIKKLAGKEKITWIYHEVRTGETLANIARNYHTTTQVLRKANGFAQREKVTNGQGILVPIRLHEKFDTSIKPIKLSDVALPSDEATKRMNEHKEQNNHQSNLGQQIRKDDSLKTIITKLYSTQNQSTDN